MSKLYDLLELIIKRVNVTVRTYPQYLSENEKLNARNNIGIVGTGKDGVDGKDGYTPVKGVDYFDGKDGKDGYTPVKGVDYFDGQPGKDGVDGKTPVKGVDYFDGQPGKDGQDGSPGADGKTPVKGEDYWTDADKQEIVDDVLDVLPTWNGGDY